MAVGNFQMLNPNDLQLERALGYEPGMASYQPVRYVTAGVNTSGVIMGGIRGLSFPKTTTGAVGTAGAAAGVQSGVQTLGATFITSVPQSVTMTTGFSFGVVVTDDGTNAADLGKVAVFGIQTNVLTTGQHALAGFGVSTAATTSPFAQAGAGSGYNTYPAEVTVAITLDSVAGAVAIGNIQIATAAGGGNAGYVLGAMTSVIIGRLRRISQATTDTCSGNVIVLGLLLGTY